MADDWRLRITFEHHADAAAIADLLERDELEHGSSEAAGQRLAVSLNDHDLFVYADERAAAEHAREMILAETERRGWKVHEQLRRWHPLAQDWEDADIELPATAGEQDEEHERLIAAERADSERYGFPEWEIKLACRSRGDAQKLAERLRAEGIASLRRDRYLLIGAPDEDAANRLADRLSGELGTSAGISIEGSLPAVAARAGGSPFALFGGLGA
jgi:hypothetical protein